MVSILSKVVDKFTKDDKLQIEDMDIEELRKERSEIKADLQMKRNKHEGLSEKRRGKFKQLKQTSDDLMKEELAEEIASLEDEMSIYYNEHHQLMDALRVIDGLMAVKRKENLMQDHGIAQELEDMDREEVIDMLKREDVQEMIKAEKWSDLRDIFRGDMTPQPAQSKRVDDIIESAEQHQDPETALQRRDRKRKNIGNQ